MKKTDIDKLIDSGTDHEVRIQAPNSSYPAGFGQVIATGKYQRRRASTLPRSHGEAPIRDATGGQSPGVHVRYTVNRFGGKTVEVDKVVPYSHIHPETRAEYDARMRREDEASEQRRRRQEQERQRREQRAGAITARFKALGYSVRYRYDGAGSFNGTMIIDVNDAARIIETLEVTR